MDDDLADTVVRASLSPAVRDAAELIDEDTVLGRVGTPRAPRPRILVSHLDTELSAPARVIPRYRFRLNDGDPVSTDVPTLVGRAPRAPRVPEASIPRLMTVPSPGHEVSATHLELRQQGASVVVTDLHSTNGTIVVVPGSDPIALRPGESFVAGPGSIIDIGDGNLIEVLSVDRLVSADDRSAR